MPVQRDLSGCRFGRFTAVMPTQKRTNQGDVIWNCKCDCGNEKEVSARYLVRGKVKSCGCLAELNRRSLIGERFGRLTVVSYAGKLNRQNRENFWNCVCDCGNNATVGQTELLNGDTKSCGCLQKEKLLVGLRLIDGTSVSILERNKKKTRSTNKSGYTGVFQEKSGKWIAYINFQKKRYWLGRYSKKEDAIKARQRGEEMHDDFLNWYYTSVVKSDSKEKRLEILSAD